MFEKEMLLQLQTMQRPLLVQLRHQCMRCLNVQPGDYVWTVPNTFVASAKPYIVAPTDFIDIDPLTSNLSIKH